MSELAGEFAAEFIGTMILILLGDGVVANVCLNGTKGHAAGWIVITMGWGLAVFTAAGMAWSFLWGGTVTRLTIAASLVSYAWFLGPDLWEKGKLWLEVRRNRRRFGG